MISEVSANDEIISEKNGGCVIRFRVQPSASKTVLKGVYGNAMKISLAAPPVDGKANKALRDFLAKRLKIPKSAVSVISGETSRNKVVFCKGVMRKDAESEFLPQ